MLIIKNNTKIEDCNLFELITARQLEVANCPVEVVVDIVVIAVVPFVFCTKV